MSLEAEVDLLEAERDALVEQVAALEAKVEALKTEVAARDQTIEWQAQRREQMRDNYERIIAAKEQATQELRQELEETPTGLRSWPRPAITPLLKTVGARIQHRRHDE